MENSEELGCTAPVNSKVASQPDDATYKQDVESQPGHDNNSFDTTTHEKAPKDPDIVDWDSSDDPANPMNWPSAKKVTAIGIASLITMLS